jgi:hypothetical protein
MRELFIVALKFYGVVSLFSGLSNLGAVIALWQSGPDNTMGIMGTWLITAAMSFVVVLCTATQAERLADLFGLKAEPARFSGFSAPATLKVGFVLIGVSQIFTKLPLLLKELASLGDPSIPASPQSNFFVLVQLALPVALVFGSSKAVKFLEKHGT